MCERNSTQSAVMMPLPTLLVFLLAALATLPSTALAQKPLFYGLCYAHPHCDGPGEPILYHPGSSRLPDGCQSFKALGMKRLACVQADCAENSCTLVETGACTYRPGPYLCVKQI